MTINELDAAASVMDVRPDRAHVGTKLWSTWLADLAHDPPNPDGLGFPALRSPGGLQVVLDGFVLPDAVEFQWGKLK